MVDFCDKCFKIWKYRILERHTLCITSFSGSEISCLIKCLEYNSHAIHLNYHTSGRQATNLNRDTKST